MVVVVFQKLNCITLTFHYYYIMQKLFTTTLSISDLVFFEIATTLCILAISWRASVEQFLWIAGIVFGAYYVHKAQNKTPPVENNNTTETK